MREDVYVLGIKSGWAGLITGDVEPLTRYSVAGIQYKGGTILGTSRTDPFQTLESLQMIRDNWRKYGLKALIVAGGNGTLTVAKRMFAEEGYPVVGVPKTIDNDVGDSAFKLIDHTPGYGSVAKYWMHMVQSANEENAGSCPADPVLVMQAMGRKIGYIPAAARLADPKREMPLQIYLTESAVTAEEMCDNVNDQLKKDGRCIIVVSEGFEVGDIGATKDSFGHTQFSASKTTVAQQVVTMLNERGLPVPGAARGQVSGTDQRDTCLYASIPDLDEAYKVGQKAALIAESGENGWMATILREPGPIYNVRYDKVPLEKVANSERTFPKEWLAPSKIDVTDEFVRYAKPLIGEDWASVPVVNGRQRFTRFKPVFAEKKLPEYTLEALRK